MKTVYLNKEGIKKKLNQWLAETRPLEKKDKEQAIKEYKKIASVYPLSEEVYDRLMILYRQLKEPEEELIWIEKAMAVFEISFNKSLKKPNLKIISLSKSLLRTTGLIDKNGRSIYQREPIGRWLKESILVNHLNDVTKLNVYPYKSGSIKPFVKKPKPASDHFLPDLCGRQNHPVLHVKRP